MTQYSVFLYGYWQHNLGDDLFLQLFLRRYPNTHVYLLTKTKYGKYYTHERITPVFNDTLLFHIKNALCKTFTKKGFIFQKLVPKVDCAVILGGSLFMEDGDWQGYMASAYSNMRKCAKKCYVLGCNFGPYKTEEFLVYFSDLLWKMDGVCLRDQYSVKLIKDTLETRRKISEKEVYRKIRYAPDIAFQLLNEETELPRSPYCDCYVISVIQPENRIDLQGYGQAYKRAALHLALHLADMEKEKPIVFFAVSHALGDAEMARELCGEMKKAGKAAAVYEYEELTESLALMKQAKAIVATHFHTMLLAFLYEVPVYPIIYNQKMKTVIKDYGFQGDSIEVQTFLWDGNEIQEKESLKENQQELNWIQEVSAALEQKPVIFTDLYEKAQDFFKDTDEILQ